MFQRKFTVALNYPIKPVPEGLCNVKEQSCRWLCLKMGNKLLTTYIHTQFKIKGLLFEKQKTNKNPNKCICNKKLHVIDQYTSILFQNREPSYESIASYNNI